MRPPFVEIGGMEFPTAECEECSGLGILSEPCSVTLRKGSKAYGPFVEELIEAQPGDSCPMCGGNGYTLVVAPEQDGSPTKH